MQHELLKFLVALEPVVIAFDNYIFWTPDIGGREVIKGLAGILSMTFGLSKVVKLAHPGDWVAALLQARATATDNDYKVKWWRLAHQTASFCQSDYNISRIAVAEDLVASEPIEFLI